MSPAANYDGYALAVSIETAGHLADVVAQNFSVVLNTIVERTEALAENLAPGDPRVAEIGAIRDAIGAGDKLVQHLVAFGRSQSGGATIVDVNEIVARMRPILTRVVGESDAIELIVETAPGACIVRADRWQLEQIVLNLAVNSRDAMPAGGALALRTRPVRLGAADAARHGLKPGDYVEISVADSGVGVDEAVQMRLFEPLVTTKREGCAGLGLAMVYGAVKQSGGHISVQSRKNEGTTVTIYLPEAMDGPGSTKQPASTDAKDESSTVLLVEEDAAVRGMMAEVLRRGGYNVIVTDSAASAFDLASTHRDAIDVLVAGTALRGTSALAFVGEIRRAKGSLPVVFVGGDAEDETAPTSGDVLRKPFTPAALIRKVRAAVR